MSRFANWIPSRRWLLFPPILIGIVVVGALARSKKPLPRVEPTELATQLIVQRVYRQPVPAVATGHGTAKPARTWSAIAEVGGRIVQAHPNLRSGIAIKQGELLVVVDPADYELQVRQREADRAQAISQLQQLQLNQSADQKSLAIQMDLLQVRASEVKRIETLQQRVAASASEFDSARAMYLQQSQTVQTLQNALTTYPAQIAAAEATIETAKAKLEEAQRNLERTRIVAPFDGLLAEVSLETGQYVAPGQSLFNVLDTSSVEIEAQFSVSQLSSLLASATDPPIAPPSPIDLAGQGDETKVKESVGGDQTGPDFSMKDQFRYREAESSSIDDLGFTATVTARSGDLTRTFTGTPIRFVSSLDEQTRTLGTIIRVLNPPGNRHADQRLRAGAYCEVFLTAGQGTDAFVIPRTSVEEDSVAIVDGDNRLRRRQVEIAFALHNDVAVVAGLSDGDLVVVNPPAVMMEGELIEPLLDGAVDRGPKTSRTTAAAKR